VLVTPRTQGWHLGLVSCLVMGPKWIWYWAWDPSRWGCLLPLETRSHKIKVASKEKLTIAYSRMLRLTLIECGSWELWGIEEGTALGQRRTLRESRPLGEAYLPWCVSDWKNQEVYYHVIKELMRIEWLLVPFGAWTTNIRPQSCEDYSTKVKGIKRRIIQQLRHGLGL
jgi:hypothetical protein